MLIGSDLNVMTLKLLNDVKGQIFAQSISVYCLFRVLFKISLEMVLYFLWNFFDKNFR